MSIDGNLEDDFFCDFVHEGIFHRMQHIRRVEAETPTMNGDWVAEAEQFRVDGEKMLQQYRTRFLGRKDMYKMIDKDEDDFRAYLRERTSTDF